MRSRFLLASPVLLVGLLALLLAVTASPDRASQHSALARAIAHPSKVAAPKTTAFINASRKVERHGFIRRSGSSVRAKGWVSVQSPSHGEDRTKSGAYRYFLHAREQRIELRVAEQESRKVPVSDQPGDLAYEPGQVVEVAGRAARGGIDVTASSIAGPALPSPALGPVATLRPTVVQRKVAIVRFYTPGNQGDLASDATLEASMNSGPRSVQKYYLQLSSNKLLITFKVFPAVQIPATTDCSQAWNGAAGAQAQTETAAQATGDSLDNYDMILNLSSLGSACGWSGGADTSFRNSYFRGMGTGGPDLRATAHELGHNMGLNHANAALATNLGAPVAISKTWTNDEYGEQSDNMGSGDDDGGMNGPTLARMGFLPLDRTLDVTPAPAASASAITLESVDQDLSAGTNPRVLRIRRPSVKDPRSPDAYLYVDLRQKDPRGLIDQFAPNTPIVNGVGVRFGASFGSAAGVGGRDAFRLLDSSPGRRGTDPRGARDTGNERNAIADPSGRTKAADHQDFFLPAGQSMYDPVEDLTISTVTLSGGQATVKVTQGPPPGNPTEVQIASGRLYVDAGAGRRNNVILSEYEGRLIVTDVGNRIQSTSGDCTQVDAQTLSCPRSGVKSAFVTLDVSGEAYSDLGAVHGSLKLPVIWEGGGGQDTLEGGPGDDTFRSGPGGANAVDADLFTGGGGNDRVVYSTRTATQPVSVKYDNTTFTDGGADEGDQVADDISGFTGGSSNDQVKLNPALSQTIDGGPGNDSVVAGPGADTIVTRDDTGVDSIACGGGNDKLFRDAGDTVDASCPTAVAPQIQITAGPEDGGATNATNPSFSFYALYATGITYTCKLENGTTPGSATPGPCTTSSGSTGTYTTPTSPTEGSKVFTVVGTVGGVSTSVSRTFRVDRTLPTSSITGGPSGTTDDANATFTFSYADNATTTPRFECSLDGSVTWTGCSSTTHYPNLAPGDYSLLVRPLDDAGNGGYASYQSWTVAADTVLDTAVDFSQDGSFPWFSGATQYQFISERPAFAFHSTSPSATIWCKVDSGAWAQCSSASGVWRPAAPLDLNLAHTIQIAAGNATAPTDSTPLTFTSDGQFYAINVNSKITSGPAEGSWVKSTSATFGFDAFWKEFWHGQDTNLPVEVIKYECKVNSGSWVSCDSGSYTATGLPQGTNTFSVRAVRNDGQRLDEDWTPAVRTFKVDTVAPTIAFTAGPLNGDWIAGPDTSFSFNANEAGSTLECQVDGAAYAPCASPKSVTGLSTATHTFRVRATDPAGNGATSARTFDVGQPHATMTGGPAAGSYTNNPTPTFTFTATHSTATFECAIGGGSSPTYSACTSPWTVPTQAAGNNVFRVRAKLPGGQLDSSFDGRLVYFDYTAPAATSIDSGPAAGSTVTTDDTAFAFSAAAETSPRFECKIDSGSWAACTSPATVASLPNGSHTWSVHTIDRAGNVGAASSRTFTVSKAKVLTIGDPAPASPTAVSLAGSVDWVQWNGTTPTALSRKAGVNQISTWSPLIGSQPNSVFAGPTTFSWTDAAGTATGTGASGVATGVANGRGFRITIPATNAATRTLKLYVGLRGVSVTDAIKASFGDGVAQQVNLTSTSDTASARVYTVTYRPTNATDTLTVDWWQGGGSAKSTALTVLYAAVVS